MEKNWRFSTDIAVYLGNSVRQADGYYGMLTGSQGYGIGHNASVFLSPTAITKFQGEPQGVYTRAGRTLQS